LLQLNSSRAFARLCAAGFLAYASYALCRTPLLPLLARQLGGTPETIGLVMAASTITGVCLKLPAGAWSDVLGRGPLLLAAAVVFTVMPFTYLAVGSLTALIVVRAAHGSATAIMGPVMSATISDLAPPDRRATWLSTYSAVQGSGQAIAPVLAGFLIARGRFDVAFAIAGCLALITPWLIARTVRADAPPSIAHARPHFSQGIREVLRERRILVASVTHAAYFAINGTLNAFLPLFAQDQIGLTVIEIGWLFGMQTVMTLAIRPLIGAASDRLGRRGAIATGLLACAVSVFGVSVADSRIALYLSVLVYAASVALTTAATSAYITDVAPKARFGAAHGVFGTIYDIGDAGGPLAGGLMIAAWGYRSTFQIMCSVAVVAALIFIRFSRIDSQ
jgi:DHA1 family multidrug resistance protein-like MFS transporter